MPKMCNLSLVFINSGLDYVWLFVISKLAKQVCMEMISVFKYYDCYILNFLFSKMFKIYVIYEKTNPVQLFVPYLDIKRKKQFFFFGYTLMLIQKVGTPMNFWGGSQ